MIGNAKKHTKTAWDYYIYYVLFVETFETRSWASFCSAKPWIRPPTYHGRRGSSGTWNLKTITTCYSLAPSFVGDLHIFGNHWDHHSWGIGLLSLILARSPLDSGEICPMFAGKLHGGILHDGHLFLPTAIRSSTSLVGPKHLELFVARPWHKSKKFKEDVSSSKRLCQIGVDGGWKSLQMTEKVVLKMCCAIEGRSQPTLQQKSSNLSNLPNFVPEFARIKRPCWASHPVIRRNHEFCAHFYAGPLAHHSKCSCSGATDWVPTMAFVGDLLAGWIPRTPPGRQPAAPP